MSAFDFEGWSARLRTLAETPGADAAHDIAHLQRVTAWALHLARAENARLEVVLPAAWLHDGVPVAKDSPDRSRASRLAAARARESLAEMAYPAEFIDAVAHCIEAHSFSAGIEPRTLEARILRDADRLDALGAIGIARCFSVGGSLGRAIHAVSDPFCDERMPDDATFSLDHFYQKLLRLVDTMGTAAGRREAQVRIDFLKIYLDRLAVEIGTPLSSS